MSSNNEKENNFFEKIAPVVAGVSSLVSGSPAPLSPNVPTQEPNYSIVEQQKSEAERWYESLPEIFHTPEIDEQLETIAEQRETEKKEEWEKELETSIEAENLPTFSGSPNPETEHESEGYAELINEYISDLEARTESGELTVTESENSEIESESESDESDAESSCESEAG